MMSREEDGGTYGASVSIRLKGETISFNVDGLSSAGAVLGRLASWLTIAQFRLNLTPGQVKTPAQVIADAEDEALRPE